MAHTTALKYVSSDAAHLLIKAAEKKALEMGIPSSIAVCDPSGTLKGFMRMDGAGLMTVQVAQDKAYTAIGFGGLSSDAWYEFIKDDGPLNAGAVVGVDRLIVFGGGFPITVDGQVVGGIGLSGGHWSQDMEIAKAALAVLQG